MALSGKVTGEIEINAPAEKFYKIFKDKAFNVPNISPGIIQAVKLHGQEDWKSHGHGSVKEWHYTTPDGTESGVFKERVEFDDQNLSMTLHGLEGEPFKYYKVFKPIYRVVPKGSFHSKAILTIEYEKLKEDIPQPYKYIDLMIGLTRNIASHLNEP